MTQAGTAALVSRPSLAPPFHTRRLTTRPEGDHVMTVSDWQRHAARDEPRHKAPATDSQPQKATKATGPVVCGTRAGYQKHRRNGEKACDPCRYANTAADRRLRTTGSTVGPADLTPASPPPSPRGPATTVNLLPAFLTTGRPSCTPAHADLLWSTNTTDEAAAKALCRTCPLRHPCATYAIDTDQQWGTWGGLTATDRLQLRHGDGWWIDEHDRVREPCGSETAKRAHHKNGEEPCDTCTAGHEQRLEERRRAILGVEHALPAGGSVRGYDTHRRLGEDACVPCKAAKARASAGKPGRPSAGRAELPSSGPMALAS